MEETPGLMCISRVLRFLPAKSILLTQIFFGLALLPVRLNIQTDGGQTFNTSGGGYFGYAPRLKIGKALMETYVSSYVSRRSATAVWYSDDGGANFVPTTGLESTT
jgi:hypothetical protein